MGCDENNEVQDASRRIIRLGIRFTLIEYGKLHNSLGL